MTTGGGPETKEVPWYLRVQVVTAGLMLFGLFALPLVWMSPKFSKRAKSFITVTTVIITAVLIRLAPIVLAILEQRLAEFKSAGLY